MRRQGKGKWNEPGVLLWKLFEGARMIINNSRYTTARTCWQKAFNTYHRRLTGRSSMALVDGSAFHAGVAHALAKGDWNGGLEVAATTYQEELGRAQILPEESYKVEDNWDLTQAMYRLYQENFDGEQVQMVQPECEFNVPLEEAKHYCIWLHWLNKESGEDVFDRPPTAEEILAGMVGDPHAGGRRGPKGTLELDSKGGLEVVCPCYTQHRAVGKIDGVFLWRGALWIMDHKTTALYPAAFWEQWVLDYQMSIYIYGLEKSINLRPRGFVVNAIFKPSEAQVSNWNSKRKSGKPQTPKDYLKYERQPFLRTTEDIERARRDFVSLCREWERRIVENDFPLSPVRGACNAYNKVCEWKPLCIEHAHSDVLSSYQMKGDNEYDYVEKELYQIPSSPTQASIEGEGREEA